MHDNGWTWRRGGACCLLLSLMGCAALAGPAPDAVSVFCGKCRVTLPPSEWAGSTCPHCSTEWNGEGTQSSVDYSMEKRCSRCNKIVPNSSHPGQRCPHCRAYWSYAIGDKAPPEEDEVDVSHRILIKSKAVLTHGTTLVPLRALLPLGADLSWDDPTHTATIGLGGRSVKVTTGSSHGSVTRGSTTDSLTWTVAPRTVNGILYVPLRGICEALRLVVDCDRGMVLLDKKFALRARR